MSFIIATERQGRWPIGKPMERPTCVIADKHDTKGNPAPMLL